MPNAEVEAYLAKLTAEQRTTLEAVRAAIHKAAPEAVEAISYGMPAFVQGKPIAGYAASARHCSYHPMSGSVVEAMGEALAGYQTSKGTIKFPIGEPLSEALVRKLVAARMAEIS